MVGNIEILAHSTWHDAADPVCYSLLCDGRKIAVATDMGGYDGYMIQALKDADALLVEANHDIRMLQVGPCQRKITYRSLPMQRLRRS